MNEWQKIKAKKKMALGRYIVADPKICHGKLTFRGTRVFVAHVLEQVTAGMDYTSISASWRGTVSVEAVQEAVRLAGEALLKYWPKMEIQDLVEQNGVDHERRGRKPEREPAQALAGKADSSSSDRRRPRLARNVG